MSEKINRKDISSIRAQRARR